MEGKLLEMNHNLSVTFKTYM